MRKILAAYSFYAQCQGVEMQTFGLKELFKKLQKKTNKQTNKTRPGHTFSHHSDDKALLEAAELATISSAFVNRTVFIC